MPLCTLFFDNLIKILNVLITKIWTWYSFPNYWPWLVYLCIPQLIPNLATVGGVIYILKFIIYNHPHKPLTLSLANWPAWWVPNILTALCICNIKKVPTDSSSSLSSLYSLSSPSSPSYSISYAYAYAYGCGVCWPSTAIMIDGCQTSI